MAKGDIVLVTFPFTDLSGSKLRPTVVLTETLQDHTVCFISTQLQWQEATDIQLIPTLYNGLRKMLAIGLLGRLTSIELNELDIKLKVLFQLP